MFQGQSFFRRIFWPPASSRVCWIYERVAPAAFALLALLFSETAFLERLENMTVDLRFRSRAPSDPKADSRLLLVGIDEPSLERFGGWPWPRERHGDMCKVLALSEPAVVSFDILFTEPVRAEDDAYLAESITALPRLVTGAITDKAADPVPPGNLRTKPISVPGDIKVIPGNKGALLPIEGLRSASYFGFVDSEPSSSDGIRRRVPLLLRVGNEVYPSLALQTLMLYWGLDSTQVGVRLGHWIDLSTPGTQRRIPITDSGEIWLNYRAKESFAHWSYHGLLTALYNDATGVEAFPKNAPTVKGKVVVVGQVASGLTDLGPSPLEGQSPLVLTVLNTLNTIFKNDYLKVVPLTPWPLLIWLAVGWVTLVGTRHQHIVRALLTPFAAIGVYVAFTWILFIEKSVCLPIAFPVLGLFLLHGGKTVIEWIDRVFAERRVSAELARAREAKKLLEQELEIAREIQFSTLPRTFPPFPDRPEVDLHAIMIPAKYVGGDLYEFFFVDNTKLFFAIGDVSGKGVPAALFMTMTLAVIRSHVIAGRSPSETLCRSNNVLALRNERCTFVTIFCGLLDTETGQLRYANGGHNPPLFMDGEGGVSFLAPEGTAIGAIEGLEFEERELLLKPNQGLFLYTDGVTEAINTADEMFEESRLTSALTFPHTAFTAEQVTARLHDQLSAFVGNAAQFDDITALAFFYRGKPVAKT